jgi:hypothetical protein
LLQNSTGWGKAEERVECGEWGVKWKREEGEESVKCGE